MKTQLTEHSDVSCVSALRLRSGSLEGVPSKVEGNLTPHPDISKSRYDVSGCGVQFDQMIYALLQSRKSWSH